MWSLGVILYLLLSGTVPFGYSAEDEQTVYRAIQRDPLVLGKPFNSISSAARELITGLLEKDPFKRYSLEQALAHPWVTGEAAADTPLDHSLVVSISNFNAKNKFKKQALRLIASALSAAEVQNLRSAFHRVDTDNTGFITYSELARALNELGMTNQEEIQALMHKMVRPHSHATRTPSMTSKLFSLSVSRHATRCSESTRRQTTGMFVQDADGDGKISYNEWLTATIDRQLVNHQQQVWQAFCECTCSSNGILCARLAASHAIAMQQEKLHFRRLTSNRALRGRASFCSRCPLCSLPRLLHIDERKLCIVQASLTFLHAPHDADDLDGDGKISVDELRQALKNEPREAVEKYIAEYDADRDGQVRSSVLAALTTFLHDGS